MFWHSPRQLKCLVTCWPTKGVKEAKTTTSSQIGKVDVLDLPLLS